MNLDGCEYVFLAGIGNSEAHHWQSLWYAAAGQRGHWLSHRSWDEPVCEEWFADLDRLIRALPGRKVLVAHSLGCVTAAEWLARNSDDSCTEALLVAVPDTRGANFPARAQGFPVLSELAPHGRLLLVMSEDDPYASADFSQELSRAWRARLVNLGRRGHINLASGLGAWEEGRALLQELVEDGARSAPSTR